MTNIGIILGSTRPGRNGEAVAQWVYKTAAERTDASFELVDLLDYQLPHLDEQLPAARPWPRRSPRSTASSSSPPSTTTPPRARSRMPSTSLPPNGTDVRSQVALSLFTDFENFSVFKPGAHQVDALNATIDQVVAWAGALAPLRAAA